MKDLQEWLWRAEGESLMLLDDGVHLLEIDMKPRPTDTVQWSPPNRVLNIHADQKKYGTPRTYWMCHASVPGLSIAGLLGQEEVRLIDSRLRSQSPPVNGLQGLLNTVAPELFDLSENANLEVIAPLPFEISETSRHTIVVKFPNVAARKKALKLTAFFQPADDPQEELIAPNDDGEGIREYQWKPRVPHGSTEGAVHVMYGTDEVALTLLNLLPAKQTPRTPRKSKSDKTKKGEPAPLVFVSCGQSTDSERQLGKEIAKLVENETSCTAYFAENQNSLDGITDNILKKLHEASAFIAVMHPRGDVIRTNGEGPAQWTRGSVWVEQEIAIAAFITQALQRPLKVLCYVHADIYREGLRDKLHIKPVSFHDNSEILKHLKSNLREEWHDLSNVPKGGLSLKPIIRHQRLAIPGGSTDPQDERHQLIVDLENDGDQDAKEFRLDVEVPSQIIDGGGHALRVNSKRQGFELFQVSNTWRKIQHLYPSDTIHELITLDYAISGKAKRETPNLLEEEVVATAYSGNMKPTTVRVPVRELLG